MLYLKRIYGKMLKKFNILSALLVIAVTQCCFAQVSTQWVARYNGASSTLNEATCMAIDNHGNTYVGGYSFSEINKENYVTIKYDADGKELWVEVYDGTGGGRDVITAVAVDEAGNVYVTGYSDGKGTGSDYLTIKYDPNGKELWAARYNGEDNKNDGAAALAVDKDGSVYVTGYSELKKSSADIVTIKYNQNGEVMWFSRFDNPNNTVDYATCLALDNSGFVYVGGYSNTSGQEMEYTILKYAVSGSLIWTKFYHADGSDYNQVTSVAPDALGNLYVTGASHNNDTKEDIATLKLDENGKLLWKATYNGPSNNTDVPSAMIVDKEGNAFVTGSSKGSGTDFDYITLKYNSEGKEVWNARYNDQSNGADLASCIAMDSLGSIYVSGSTWNGTDEDYATIKYNPLGAELWVAKYNGPGNSIDRATAISVGSGGDLFVTGFGVGASGVNEFATIKYTQTPSESSPGLVSPSSGSTVTDPSPVLQWNILKNADMYRLQVSTDQSFYQTFIDIRLDLASAKYKIPSSKLTSNTIYFWRVGALNAAGSGPWSPIWTFSIK